MIEQNCSEGKLKRNRERERERERERDGINEAKKTSKEMK